MRLLVLLALLTPAIAHADVAMTVATHGSSIDLTFRNQTAKPLALPIRVVAEFAQYDWLEVTLKTKATTRTLHFIAAREKSAAETVTVAPNKSHTETIDLVPWVLRDGDPLAPGDYTLLATWTLSRGPSAAALVASAKLTIAAPVEKPCKGAGTTGLALLARQVGNTTVVEIGLHNTGTTKICAYAKVLANEDQSDWLAIAIDDPKNLKAKPRVLQFVADRDKSAYQYVELAPGATSWTRWDLATWASAKHNGGTPLAHGATFAHATYDSSSATDVWRGKLATEFAIGLP